MRGANTRRRARGGRWRALVVAADVSAAGARPAPPAHLRPRHARRDTEAAAARVRVGPRRAAAREEHAVAAVRGRHRVRLRRDPAHDRREPGLPCRARHAGTIHEINCLYYCPTGRVQDVHTQAYAQVHSIAHFQAIAHAHARAIARAHASTRRTA